MPFLSRQRCLKHPRQIFIFHNVCTIMYNIIYYIYTIYIIYSIYNIMYVLINFYNLQYFSLAQRGWRKKNNIHINISFKYPQKIIKKLRTAVCLLQASNQTVTALQLSRAHTAVQLVLFSVHSPPNIFENLDYTQFVLILCSTD